MIPQREMNESTREQTGSMYGGYEGDQEYARQHDVTPYEQMLREEPEGKVYPPQQGSMNMFYQFLIVFVLSMVALFAFAVLCLVWVGGTGGLDWLHRRKFCHPLHRFNFYWHEFCEEGEWKIVHVHKLIVGLLSF